MLKRAHYLSKMIPGTRNTVYPDRPTLFVWAKPVANGFEFPEQTRQLGSALVAIPLVIERTPPRTQVTIPSPFLPYRTDRNEASSPSYDNRTGDWLERKGAAQTWLRVQLPREVLPIKLGRAVVTLHINGPVTKIEIVGKAAGQTVVLASRNDPVGTVRLEIDRENFLLLDDGGGLRLGVFVFVSEAKVLKTADFDGGINRWKIEYFRVEVEGATLDP